MSIDATTVGAAAKQQRLHFPLQEDEHVLRVVRRHWLYLWPRLAAMALAALVPPAAVSLLMSATGTYEGIAARIFWIAAAVYLLYWGVRIALTWYRYNNDIWVITDQRIIDSVKTTPFHLRLGTADLVNVQDMRIARNGLLRTMFDYGDIVCQTASEQQDFGICGIPDPRGIQALVDRERDRERMRNR